MGESENTGPATAEPLFGEVNGMPLNIPIIGLCGAKGSGKTLAGLSIDPDETELIDVEDSSATYNLKLKARHSLYAEVESATGNIPTPLECWLWFESIIDKIDARVLFVDPITDLQSGVVDYVRSNPKKFGKTAAQYEKASGLLWADVKSHLKMTLGRLSRRVECFVFTAHMGSVWQGGKPVVGKQKAKGVDTFYELASLYLYLRREPDPKTGKVPAKPVASIVPPLGKSRLAVTNMVNGEFVATPILPPTIKDFTWKLLREYVAKPPDYSRLKKDQLAQSTELTDDERLQLQAEIAADQREAEELRSGRLDAAAAAAKKNTEAQAAAALEATRKAANDSPSGKDAHSSSVATAGDTGPISWENADLSDIDRIAVIKEQFKQLRLTKEQMVKAIEKRGGAGAKLGQLDTEKLVDLHNALWTKLTSQDLEAKK